MTKSRWGVEREYEDAKQWSPNAMLVYCYCVDLGKPLTFQQSSGHKGPLTDTHDGQRPCESDSHMTVLP